MAKQAKRRKIGHLECIEVLGDPSGPTIVMFHGYGADMMDLASLSQAVQAPKNANWYFPNGHLTVPLGEHYEGRAWFPISLSELERGGNIDLSTVVPPGLKRARENALGFLEKLGAPPEKLVLGGFSQGAMLATDTMLHMEKPPAGLALLSSTLVNAEAWFERAKQHPGFRFFQAHGARDQVLSFALAQRLEKLLKDAGWSGHLQRFEGAHEIPSEVLIQLGAFLRKVLV
jgi:phospholipase/carboxylesterase